MFATSFVDSFTRTYLSVMFVFSLGIRRVAPLFVVVTTHLFIMYGREPHCRGLWSIIQTYHSRTHALYICIDYRLQQLECTHTHAHTNARARAHSYTHFMLEYVIVIIGVHIYVLSQHLLLLFVLLFYSRLCNLSSALVIGSSMYWGW